MDSGESQGAEEAEQRAGEPDWTLLARYLAGEATAAERAVVARWAAGPAGRAELAALQAWWEQAAVLPSADAVDAMWERLSREMREGRDDAPRAAAGTPARRRAASVRATPRVLALVPAHGRARWRRAAGVAAVLAVAASGAGLWHVARAGAPGVARRDEAPLREFVTRAGQRATIDLVDGTKVTLGVASTLRVRPFGATGRGARELYLEGEAVFDVAHDARRPFLVHARGAVTEDLGTRFGVRAYEGDGAVRVVVAEGEVALRPAAAPAGTGALLGPGDVGRLDAAGRAVVERGVDTDAHLGWAAGRLVFHDAPVSEVAAQLGRWFDVTIDVDADVAARRVTVNMPAGALTPVLRAVTVPLELRYAYDREGRSVRIGP